MTTPAIIFGILISSFIGAAFHLWRGGSLARLILYLILSWIGFWVGHYIAYTLEWTFLSLGPLRLGFAIIGDIFVLLFGYWLSLVRIERDR